MKNYAIYIGPLSRALQQTVRQLFAASKKNLQKTSLLVLLLLGFGISAHAQGGAQQIRAGMSSPDFALAVQLGGKGKTIKRTLSDYRGRWLLLEFWSKTCATCIKGFPKLQSYRDSLSGKLDIILIGKSDRRYNEGIQQMYQRIAKEENLRLDVAFDTLSFTSFGVWATPNAVVIAPDGTIRSISTGGNLSIAALGQLMKEGTADIPQLVDGRLVALTPAKNKRIRVDTTGTTAHASELSGWTFSESSTGARNIGQAYRAGVLESAMSSLSDLYLLGYFGHAFWNGRDSLFGRVWPKPVLETSDSSRFQSSYSRQKNLFRYRLEMTDKNASAGLAMAALQGDLSNWFGYQVSIETRAMPIWQLVVTGPTVAEKLKSRSLQTSSKGDHSGLALKKVPMQRVVNMVNAYYPDHITLDATGISGDIDITIEASLASLSSLRAALAANGLALVNAQKSMQVLVIRDPTP